MKEQTTSEAAINGNGCTEQNNKHTLTIPTCGLERSIDIAQESLQSALDKHYIDLRRVANQYQINDDHFVNFWHIRFPLHPVAYAYNWAEWMSDSSHHHRFSVEDLSAMVSAGFDYDWIESCLVRKGE